MNIKTYLLRLGKQGIVISETLFDGRFRVAQLLLQLRAVLLRFVQIVPSTIDPNRQVQLINSIDQR